MLDRRQQFRGRVYYGGVIGFNGRNSTVECLVRNFSEFGAKVEFDNTALLPDEVDLLIPRKGTSWLARIVWRGVDEAGFAFRNPKRLHAAIPLDMAIRARANERAMRVLRRRIEQLNSEH